jgi:hypothetical protein
MRTHSGLVRSHRFGEQEQTPGRSARADEDVSYLKMEGRRLRIFDSSEEDVELLEGQER